MNEIILISIFISSILILLGSGVWVGISLVAASIIGMELFTNRPTGDAIAMAIWDSISSWNLTSLPLFILMGEILLRTKLSELLFKGLSPWTKNLPGGLVHINVIGSTFFAAISGSSAATAAIVGKMSIPELKKRHYPDSIVIGTLAGASTLGLLIPPSIALIVYGVTVNESISKLFIAGVAPGLMLALMFMLYIVFNSMIKKDLYEKVTSDDQNDWKAKIKGIKLLFPVVGLIAAVIGSIYIGFATPTEASVLGVVGSAIIALFQGTLTRDALKQSLTGAIKTSCMIALILLGAKALTLAMGFTGLPRILAENIADMNLTPFYLILALTAFYIILGCFLDGLSSIVLTMAVIDPIVRQAGFDMIWFGIYLIVVIEMAQITPPVGFNLFVLQSMTNKGLGYIAKASFPMFLIMLLGVFLLVLFPSIVTYLPGKM